MVILESSYKNLKWILKKTNSKNIEETLLEIYNISPENQLSLDKFFNKSLKDYWPKNGEILDIDKAIKLIEFAMLNNKKIGIVGDYDVDGSSATGLLILYFNLIKIDFTFHIPNRFTEGYGVSKDIIAKLFDKGVDIIITVDNGTTAYEAIDYVKECGKKMIILDHHHLQKDIETDAFVNPHRTPNGFEILCATGVVFVFLVELNHYLYKNKLISEKINVLNFIDVAAVATICDVMPLIGINRVIVAKGIEKINKNPIPGYKAILEQYMGNIDIQTIGFSLGPCINAPGRLNSAIRAVELVVETDEKKARIIAADLISMNEERKEIQSKALEVAEEQIKVLETAKKHSITVYGELFEGVIGILAGRLKDRYNKPVCVLTTNQGFWKGSLRSIEGFHVGNLVHDAIKEGIGTLGGGHEMAGGISLPEANLQLFIDFFENQVKNTESIEPKKEIFIDLVISLQSIPEVSQIMEKFGPFGPSFSEPTFLFPNCLILYKRNFPKSILITLVSQNFKNPIDVWFFSPEPEIVNILKKDQSVHIVGNILKSKGKFSIKVLDFFILTNDCKK